MKPTARPEARPRPRFSRPVVEALEERLPPGDWLLGAVLGAPLGAFGLFADEPSPWTAEESASVTAARRGARLAGLDAAEARPLAPVAVSLFERAGTAQAPGGGNVSDFSAHPPPPEADHPFAFTAIEPLLDASPPRPVAPAMPAAEGPGAGVFVGWAAVAGPDAAGVLGATAPPPPAANADTPGGTAVLAGPALGPQSGAVHARFDLSVLARSPFPSNRWTVADPSQNTNLHVKLPDPVGRPSDFEDVQVINTLDGFNLQPRLSVPFDGPIDVHTVNSNTVFLVSLGDTLDHHDRGGQVVGIDQVVWDPASNTLHVESDALLEQHTRYALIVTNGVRDLEGHRVQADEAFRRFRQTVDGDYKHDLLDAVHAARRLGVREDQIVTASVFTTMSTTAVLEKVRNQIHATTPAPAEFLLGSNGERTVFARSEVTGITFRQQTAADPPGFTNVSLPLPQLDIFPGVVGQLAFGRYSSPDYQVHPGEYIPQVPTRTGTPVVRGYNEIYFNLFLPSGTKPDGGWPVAIVGHGVGGNKNVAPLNVAATMAKHGIATIAINASGNGFGPLGTLIVNPTAPNPVTFSAGGRSIDQDGDHRIGGAEGQSATAPQTIVMTRDGLRQTVADLMQLVRVIEVGMDVDGDNLRDLDPSHISYFGSSFGGIFGTIFLAVEPSVPTGVVNVAGGAWVELGRLSPVNRFVAGRFLDERTPSVLNLPAEVTAMKIDGVTVNDPQNEKKFFNENMPLRHGESMTVTIVLQDGTSQEMIIRSPVINTVAGAMAIQEVIEHAEWVSQSGNPVAYAPHLRKDPLPGVDPKSVIVSFARGDQTVPNPTNTALLRAGELADRTTFYRADLAFAENPAVPKNPHAFLLGAVSSPVPLVREIALGAQEQIAVFIASNGAEVIHPEPKRFFEVPIVGPLPEGLNYIP